MQERRGERRADQNERRRLGRRGNVAKRKSSDVSVNVSSKFCPSPTRAVPRPVMSDSARIEPTSFQTGARAQTS